MMNATITMDRAGRVVLPKRVRDQLRLAPGDALDLAVDGDELTLRPQRRAARMRKKQGIWVFGGEGPAITQEQVNQVLQDSREQRMRHILGDRR